MHGGFWLGLVTPGILFTALAVARTPAMEPEFQASLPINTRGQMAVFLVKTSGLQIYGP